MTPEDQQLDPMLQFFSYAHLPPHLREISAPFGIIALQIVTTLPRNPERTVALRKLLEAKDCAVRAYLYRDTMQGARMQSEGGMTMAPDRADRPPVPPIIKQRPGETDRPTQQEREQAAAAFDAKLRATLAGRRIEDQPAPTPDEKPPEG